MHFFDNIFSAVPLYLLNDTLNQNYNPPLSLNQQAVPHHCCPDTHSNSCLYCDATALQRASLKYMVKKPNQNQKRVADM